MADKDRHQSIIEHLRKNKTASVGELSATLFVSPATIRRDLTELQKLGQVERTHGGAVYLENADEISIFVRLSKNAKEKEKAATIALKYIPDFQTVFIDNSSTALALAERMNLQHKTVVTNGLQVAMRLSQKSDVNIIIPGGEVHYNTNAVTGSIAISQLMDFRFDLMLSSCAAINLDGSFEHSLDTMQIKKIALERSRRKLLLADYTKFGLNAMYKTTELSNYHGIITNAEDYLIAPFRNAGLKIVNK